MSDERFCRRKALAYAEPWAAARFAAKAHHGQRRKYSGAPYIRHPYRVAVLCARVGAPIAVVRAAFLHDVLEDTPTTLQDLIEAFGLGVANLVDEVTCQYTKERHPDKSRNVRKKLAALRLRDASAGARCIKFADMADNVRDIAAADPDFARTYLDEKQFLARQMAPTSYDPRWLVSIHNVALQECLRAYSRLISKSDS